jgi:hypothetical protein
MMVLASALCRQAGALRRLGAEAASGSCYVVLTPETRLGAPRAVQHP